MTVNVYVVKQYNVEPFENFYDGINKVFASEESAKAYVQENKNTFFPEDRDEGICENCEGLGFVSYGDFS